MTQMKNSFVITIHTDYNYTVTSMCSSFNSPLFSYTYSYSTPFVYDSQDLEAQ